MYTLPEVETLLLKENRWVPVKVLSHKLGTSISRDLDGLLCRTYDLRNIVFKYNTKGTKVVAHKSIVDSDFSEPERRRRPSPAKTKPVKAKKPKKVPETDLIDQFVTLIDTNRTYKNLLISLQEQIKEALRE